MTAIKQTSKTTPIKLHPYARATSTASPAPTPMMDLPTEKKHITISLSDPTLTRYGDAIYDPAFLAIALDPAVPEKEKLKAARGVRNRLSAACSRQKRKELLDGLKDDNERLKAENGVLMDEVKRLRAGSTSTSTSTSATTVRDEEPLKAVSPAPQVAALPTGTIDPTSLSSSAPSQSAHLALIGELITTNQSLQSTITSLVADRDSWKGKYEALMTNISRLGASPVPKTEDEVYVTSPTKSTTSTLVSEYLLDTASSPDVSMDDFSSGPPSSPSTPARAMSPRETMSLSRINTCHPAAVEKSTTLPDELVRDGELSLVGKGKSPAAGVDSGNDIGSQWHDAPDGLWIPSGLGLDLGVPPSSSTTAAAAAATDEAFYLATFDTAEPEKDASHGIMQTLFDIGPHVPPLSAVEGTEFSIPAFDFTTLSSTTSTPVLGSAEDGERSSGEQGYDELTIAGAGEWDTLESGMMGVV